MRDVMLRRGSAVYVAWAATLYLAIVYNNANLSRTCFRQMCEHVTTVYTVLLITINKQMSFIPPAQWVKVDHFRLLNSPLRSIRRPIESAPRAKSPMDRLDKKSRPRRPIGSQEARSFEAPLYGLQERESMVLTRPTTLWRTPYHWPRTGEMSWRESRRETKSNKSHAIFTSQSGLSSRQTTLKTKKRRGRQALLA